jgi:hypothetical protein
VAERLLHRTLVLRQAPVSQVPAVVPLAGGGSVVPLLVGLPGLLVVPYLEALAIHPL